MNNCGEWASASEIVRRVQAYNKRISGKRGDRNSILNAIRNLADDDYLEFEKVKNRHEYMRNDKADSELKFSSIMKGFEDIQKMQLDEINQDKIIFLSNNRLAIDGQMLLDSIQDEMEKAYTLMVRMNYQAQLDVMTKREANARSKRLQEHIDKTMKMLKRKYPANLIKEYFQNHIKNLQFKI
jgi:hypothetical protein